MRPEKIVKNSGFTLLELLLSLTIMAIIMVVIFGTFRVSIRAWERGERDIEQQHRTRTVLELMQRQLASMAASPILEKKNKPVMFQGEADRMTFVSKLALNPRNQAGDVYVQYRVDRDSDGVSLQLLEQAAPMAADRFDVDDPPSSVDPYPLLQAAQSLTFEYCKGVDAEGKFLWQENWNPVAEKTLPEAIRIRLVPQKAEEPIVVLAPVRSRGEV